MTFNDFNNQLKEVLSDIVEYDGTEENKRIICNKIDELARQINNNSVDLEDRKKYITDLITNIFIFIANH